MKHAGPESLGPVEGLLEELRAVPGMTEKRPGVFYRKSAAFLHFHTDPAGLFADVKVDGQWERYPVGTEVGRAQLLARLHSA